ncbi:MAG: hypothetical protein WC438_04660 [Candidatus Pacearchaeota archaeon]
MISLRALLGMVETEAVEAIHESRANDSSYKPKPDNLPPINYRLELIQKPNESYEWVE